MEYANLHLLARVAESIRNCAGAVAADIRAYLETNKKPEINPRENEPAVKEPKEEEKPAQEDLPEEVANPKEVAHFEKQQKKPPKKKGYDFFF